MIPQLTTLELSTVNAAPHIQATADRILERLRAATATGRSLRSIASALASTEGAQDLLGDLEKLVAVLPREMHSCAQIALAVAAGTSGAHGFLRSVQAIHNYALLHRGEVKVLLLVTDIWNLGRHLPDLRAIASNGTQVRVVLGGEAIDGLVELPLEIAVVTVQHALA